MSKTLTLKKLDVVATDGGKISIEDAVAAPDQPLTAPIKAYTADELRAMLAAMGEPEKAPRVVTDPTSGRVVTDVTMDLSIDMLPAHEIADKSKLPPVDERSGGVLQIPAGVHGRFGLNGIPLIAPGVDLNQTINPATGLPYVQAGARSPTQIQVPPQQFGRRLPR